MIRKLLVFLLLAVPCLATTTVTGSLKNLGTGSVTSSSNAFVRFWLRGCRGNQPRITGTGAIAPQQSPSGVFYFDLAADASGNVSGTIYSTRDSAGTGNGEIECGLSYTAVWYGMQVYNGGAWGPEVPITAKSGATIDVSNVTPNTTQPVTTAPTGDTTYLRLDGGNSPATGPITFDNLSVVGAVKQLNDLGGSRFLADSPMGPYTMRVNPILDIGAGGSWDSNLIQDFWVVKDPATGKFHGFYSAVNAGGITQIGHATSDDGVNWTKDGSNPIITAPGSGWNQNLVGKPVVVPSICGSAWCMYVLGKTTSGFGLYTAASLSGPWSAYASNPVLSPGGTQESADYRAVSAYVEGGTLYLFYMASDAVDYVSRIFLATSSDGKTFAKQGKVADVGAGGQWDSGWIAPGSIVKTAEGLYVMSYNAGNGTPGAGNLEPAPQGIGFLYSTSLTTGWTRYSNNPVVQTDANFRDLSNTVWRGYIVQIGGRYYLNVDAGDNSNFERQFLAELQRTTPSSVAAQTIQADDACVTIFSTHGGRTAPTGQYLICSSTVSDALGIYRNGVLLWNVDSTGRATATNGYTGICHSGANGTAVAGCHVEFGGGTLTSASPSTATITFSGASAFTNASTYSCTVSNNTTQANSLKVVETDGTHFTVTGPNTVTDSFTYVCAGN